MTAAAAPRPPAPYPADTRARGWRFELDYERIDQSDTWGLAAEIPMAQPALLMMWLVAWTREPCGSLPNDENIIRAKCKIPAAIWPKLRGVLMRGWWLAEDGLLYHPTLTKRVQEMLDYRRKTAERVANYKAAQREQRVGNALPTGEQRGKNDTGTGTGTIENQIPPQPPGERGAASPSDRPGDEPDDGKGEDLAGPKPKPAKAAKRNRADPPTTVPVDWLIAAGFDPQLAADFIAHKDRLKAPLTERAWTLHQAEARKAGWTPAAAAERVIAKNWKGFEAEYVRGQAQPGRFLGSSEGRSGNGVAL